MKMQIQHIKFKGQTESNEERKAYSTKCIYSVQFSSVAQTLRKEISQINYLSLILKKLGKEDKYKPKQAEGWIQ